MRLFFFVKSLGLSGGEQLPTQGQGRDQCFIVSSQRLKRTLNAQKTWKKGARRHTTHLHNISFPLMCNGWHNVQNQNLNQKASFSPKGAVSRQHQAVHTHSSCTVWTEVETSVHGWSRTLRARVQEGLEDTLTDALLVRHYIPWMYIQLIQTMGENSLDRTWS